jgi:hypothetical protein
LVGNYDSLCLVLLVGLLQAPSKEVDQDRDPIATADQRANNQFEGKEGLRRGRRKELVKLYHKCMMVEVVSK